MARRKGDFVVTDYDEKKFYFDNEADALAKAMEESETHTRFFWVLKELAIYEPVIKKTVLS